MRSPGLFFLKIVLDIQSPCGTLWILRLLFYFCKKCCHDFDRACNGIFRLLWVIMDILTTLSFPSTLDFFPFVFISFGNVLHTSLYLVRFIPKFFFFDTIGNEIFLIPFSDCPLLVYRNTAVFYVDFVSCNFAEFISSNHFCGIFSVIVSSVNRDNFTPLL